MGHFTAPVVLKVRGIADLEQEIFGPVLHVATFRARDLDGVIDAINASGYGLTFGLQTRIDGRVQHVADRLKVGNLYVNRNQVGAVVGSQPFGGEGLSGTGPKAGGPDYLPRFSRAEQGLGEAVEGPQADPARVAEALRHAPWPQAAPAAPLDLPGPTGEMNRLTHVPRGPVLCLGPGLEAARAQAAQARAAGCPTVIVAPGATEGIDGVLAAEALADLPGLAAVALWRGADLRAVRAALARRAGPLIPLLGDAQIGPRCRLERHLCVDTTASGGNAALMMAAGAAEG
jgi:RHH-type proline utilization regulon transcriptional repressor/proline dehydrogenase/delta 1-pyrroline-5-carboxylate dehydrogenase